MLKPNVPSVQADLDGIAEALPDDGMGRHHNYLLKKCVTSHFAGIDVSGGEFRVPAADLKVELFFNNRELLARYTGLTLPAQQAFLCAVRETLKKHEVNKLDLVVQWSSKSTRTIHIEKINSSGCLNIYL